MPVPAEYQRIRADFYAFLVDLRDRSGLWSTHAAYTMAQAVFQVFRRRLTIADAICFSNALPAGLRALFVAEWDVSEPQCPFACHEELLAEVRSLRPDHNFSTDNAIIDVAQSLFAHVERDGFQKMLSSLPPDAVAFWQDAG